MIFYTQALEAMTESIMQKIPSFIISNNSNQERIAKYYNKKDIFIIVTNRKFNNKSK